MASSTNPSLPLEMIFNIIRCSVEDMNPMGDMDHVLRLRQVNRTFRDEVEKRLLGRLNMNPFSWARLPIRLRRIYLDKILGPDPNASNLAKFMDGMLNLSPYPDREDTKSKLLDAISFGECKLQNLTAPPIDPETHPRFLTRASSLTVWPYEEYFFTSPGFEQHLEAGRWHQAWRRQTLESTFWVLLACRAIHHGDVSEFRRMLRRCGYNLVTHRFGLSVLDEVAKFGRKRMVNMILPLITPTDLLLVPAEHSDRPSNNARLWATWNSLGSRHPSFKCNILAHQFGGAYRGLIYQYIYLRPPNPREYALVQVALAHGNKKAVKVFIDLLKRTDGDVGEKISYLLVEATTGFEKPDTLTGILKTLLQGLAKVIKANQSRHREFQEALRSADMTKVNSFLASTEFDPSNASEKYVRELLPLAMNAGRRDLVETLIDRGVNPNGPLLGRGKVAASPPPLKDALLANNLEFASVLLDNGASFEVGQAVSAEGSTLALRKLLKAAVILGNSGAVELALSKGADPVISSRKASFVVQLTQGQDDDDPSYLWQVLLMFYPGVEKYNKHVKRVEKDRAQGNVPMNIWGRYQKQYRTMYGVQGHLSGEEVHTVQVRYRLLSDQGQ
ncbi:uncharacterized protein DSM5745_07908 [Aspergillus mulundensis]|uniref:Uncharacterized protein n=1 Tax=Aspergillus mulundensis TaxID=1810919 RepID=A0A3D8RFJ6_9EURO|nr:hypothetical protein DSM5745_07908 [Aspergillus mulundensis]RDW72736.1 hypothetical protein DSM5745_07908 [Aspergillus mulundensis]